jgi:hypothetical protein
MIDGHQMTICFHVDDCILSHKSPKAVDDMIACLKDEYENIFKDGTGKMMTVSHGKVHKYLGMTLDYTTPGQVKISMFDYINEILAAFEAAPTPKDSGPVPKRVPLPTISSRLILRVRNLILTWLRSSITW